MTLCSTLFQGLKLGDKSTENSTYLEEVRKETVNKTLCYPGRDQMQNHSMLVKSAVATSPRSRVSLVARIQVALKYLLYFVVHF